MKHNMITAVFNALFAIALFACNQPSDATHQKNLQIDSATQQLDEKFTEGFSIPGRLFPDKLRGISNEIIAAHYPNPCFATFEDSMYVWKHNTTVQTKEDLQLIEYGSFIYTKKGWYLRVTMSPDEFAKYYNCPNGLLKKGVVYTDKESWRRDQNLTGGDAMWYFLARDKNGRIVKGTAPIETEGKLLRSTIRGVEVKSAAINWTGYGEIGGYSLTGSIQLKKATIVMDSNTLKNAVIVIDVTSISHKDDNLQKHLRDEDFFDVTKYPTATFESEEIVYSNASNALVKGSMTIKGIKKQLQFPIKVIENKNGAALSGKMSIDRTAFGIKYHSKSFFGDLGDQAIKNKFDLTFEVEIR